MWPANPAPAFQLLLRPVEFAADGGAREQAPADAAEVTSLSVGARLEASLELAAVVDRQQPGAASASAAAPSAVPPEALELRALVSVGAVRWEAMLPSVTPPRWVPAPPTARSFPFRDGDFTATADHVGLRLRALAILHEVASEKPILFRSTGSSAGAGREERAPLRPAVVASAPVRVVETSAMRAVMDEAVRRGQVGVFAVEDLADDDEPAIASAEDDADDDKPRATDVAPSAPVTGSPQRAARRMLVACKRIAEGALPALGHGGRGICVRVCEAVAATQPASPASAARVLAEGRWELERDAAFAISPCALSCADRRRASLFFRPESAECDLALRSAPGGLAELRLVFASPLDRDTAVLGIRSLA